MEKTVGHIGSKVWVSTLYICCLIFLPWRVEAQTPCLGAVGAFLQAPFNSAYQCVSLGSVPGVPANYGGLTLKYDDPNTLLIGGQANSSAGRIYQIGVMRAPVTNQITGFTGLATVYPSAGATVGQNSDGGVIFGPGNVLFVARFPQNELEQSKPGSMAPDRVVDLTAVGVAPSVGAIAFIPSGFPGANQMVIGSYSSGDWYRATLTVDGSGTYSVSGLTAPVNVGGGPEGIAFVPQGSSLFPMNSVLITRYGTGSIITMTLDGNGDPALGSDRNVITGLSGVEGAFIDPVTGDFLFSTYGGGNQVIRVSGFLAPTAASVSLSGRVSTPQGTGISGARVSLTDAKGQTTIALTNGFGFYSFQGVMVGQTYVVAVSSKRYEFSPRTISVLDELTDLDFVPEP